MLTKGAHHVSLDVSDVEISKAFYGELLGLPEIERPDIGLPGVWYQAGPVQLHLIQVPAGADVGRPASTPTPLANHVAFEIEDCDTVRLELERAGYEVIALAKSRQLFVADPDGNMVEFIQPLAR